MRCVPVQVDAETTDFHWNRTHNATQRQACSTPDVSRVAYSSSNDAANSNTTRDVPSVDLPPKQSGFQTNCNSQQEPTKRSTFLVFLPWLGPGGQHSTTKRAASARKQPTVRQTRSHKENFTLVDWTQWTQCTLSNVVTLPQKNNDRFGLGLNLACVCAGRGEQTWQKTFLCS